MTDKNAGKTSFIIQEEKVELTAIYKKKEYQLTVHNAQGSGKYTYGSIVQLIPNEVTNSTFCG